MKKFLTVGIVFLISLNVACAQNMDVYNFETGVTALTVSVPDSDAAAVGGKYFLDRKNAIEGGVSFNFQHEKTSKQQEDGLYLEVFGAYIQYLDFSRISPYLKYGGSVSYAMGDHYENLDQDDFGLSALVGLGAEFFVTRQFSISGEALMNFQLAPCVRFQTITPSLKASFYFDYLIK